MSKRSLGSTLIDWLDLTKPQTIHVVVGAIPAMLLAGRGTVTPVLMLNVLTGAIFMASGANALNCVVDADIDKLMKRTADRPLARGAVSTRHALAFGLALSVAAFVWLWVTTTQVAALLAAATTAFYVLVYTLLLKRRSKNNVVWGGAANGMPAVIGWSAVTGTIGWQALVMFAIILFWTPPHSWALAMRHKDDYRAAGVPMLPAVTTERRVIMQILIYTWLTVITTLLLAFATGWLYGAIALLAGAWLLLIAYQLYAQERRGDPPEPLRLFRRSNTYLATVFCALAVDSALAVPGLAGH